MTNKHYSLIGILAVVIFWSAYFIIANQRPEYSYLTKAISELGSVDVSNKWIWNISGYIVPGILIAIFGYGLYKSLATEKSNRLALFGITLSGLFMTLSGIFPGDFEDRQSTTMLLHTIGSFGSYLFFLVGAFTYPKLMKTSQYWKNAIKPTIIITLLTMVFGGWAFVFPNIPALGQRIVFGFYFLWIIFVAIKLYRQPMEKRKQTAKITYK